MKMFGHPKREFFTSKARLNSEVYGQASKITPEAGKKRLLYARSNSTVHTVASADDNVTVMTDRKQSSREMRSAHLSGRNN